MTLGRPERRSSCLHDTHTLEAMQLLLQGLVGRKCAFSGPYPSACLASTHFIKDIDPFFGGGGSCTASPWGHLETAYVKGVCTNTRQRRLPHESCHDPDGVQDHLPVEGPQAEDPLQRLPGGGFRDSRGYGAAPAGQSRQQAGAFEASSRPPSESTPFCR